MLIKHIMNVSKGIKVVLTPLNSYVFSAGWMTVLSS